MRIKQLKSYLLWVGLLIPVLSSATTFHAKSDGNWSDTNTWVESGFPGASDDVIIDGYMVTVLTNAEANNITITNASASGPTGGGLEVNGIITMTVYGDLSVTAENVTTDVEVKVLGEAIFTVNGNLSFNRSSDNNTKKILRLYLLDDSQTFVGGNFTFDYESAATNENDYDIFTQDKALLDVTGTTSLITRGGSDLDFMIFDSSEVVLRDSLELLLLGGKETAITANDDSHIQILADAYLLNSNGSNHTKLKTGDMGGKMTITGDVTMESTAALMDVKLEVKGATAEMNIQGDITINAAAEQDVHIDLKNDGTLYLGGNIERKTAFGYLTMELGTSVVLNGSGAQTLPASVVDNSGSDSFEFTDLSIEKTDMSTITLAGDLIVSENLNLTQGIIESSDAAMLIIEDRATITGGNSQAYVAGPIQKQGRTNGNPFVFHTGDKGVYAPMEISAMSNTASVYTAQYKSDPPPFGILSQGIVEVSNKQHWEVERAAGSEQVEITLHWKDPSFEGFTNISALLVVGLDSGGSWKNYGNGGTTGNTVADVPGSVSTNLGVSDPPPFGIASYTFGTDEVGGLPVELLRFEAVQEDEEVYLQWETATEINSSHFLVERSLDGVHYEVVDRVEAEGDTNSNRVYSSRDRQPYYGNNFYRLKIVDRDETYEYSNISVVKFEVTPEVLLYPNPVQNQLQLKGVDLREENGMIEIFTRGGHLVYKGKVSFNNGSFEINTENINLNVPGYYILQIKLPYGDATLKFIKSE